MFALIVANILSYNLVPRYDDGEINSNTPTKGFKYSSKL